MTDKIVRAPVRIQIWLPDNRGQIEVRGWADSFETSRDLPPRDLQDFSRGFRLEGTTHVELKAHVGTDYDRPWKFKRGRPNV